MGDIMLNQERVCEMTRLAIFDQGEGRECRPMIQYFRKDYIARELLKSFITGTVAFFVCVAALGLYHLEELMEQINILDIPKLAVRGILIYMACMAVYLSITYAVYHIRYTKGRQKVKKYYLHLKRVNRLYREEEQM
ncbi:MAG: hypothetical protein HFJ05_07810 [Eubacterium sp.]|nr:hypothetical protein [Eubacterium sp.]